MHHRSLALALAFLAPVASATAQDTLLTYQVFGRGGATFRGLIDRPAVQRVLLAVAAEPRAATYVEQELRGTGVSREDLERSSLLRRDGAREVIGFTLLTQVDVRHVRQVGDRYAASLADAVLARRAAFDRLLRGYDAAGVAPEAVAYIVVGCFSLDWDGLELTAAEGYRGAPRDRDDGRYIAWAEERGELSVNAWPDEHGHPSLRGLFWGSHNGSEDDVAFTSFGDHASLPRAALPDVLWRLQSAVALARVPETVRSAVALTTASAVAQMQRDAGHLLFAVRDGARSLDEVAKAAGLSPERAGDQLELLVNLEYVTLDERGYMLHTPVFTRRDQAMIDSVRAIGHEVLHAWLAAHYHDMERDLGDLSAVRAGVPFADGFIQLWHYLFGAANRDLVQAGFFADPYAADRKYQGFIPSARQFPADGDRDF